VDAYYNISFIDNLKGIYGLNISYNVFDNIHVAGNDQSGIELKLSVYNEFINSNIINNSGYGMFILGCSNNTFHHNNFIGNAINALDDGINNYTIFGAIIGINLGNLITIAWSGLGDGNYILNFYCNDSAGNIVNNSVRIEKGQTSSSGQIYPDDDDDSTGDGGEDGIDMRLILIIIGIAATIAILGVIFGRRSSKTLKKREAELANLIAQREEITEGDITISKEKHVCLVHKGPIEGYSWICPSCGAYYCMRCIEVLKESENICWSCETPIDHDRPSAVSLTKQEGKKKKKHIDIGIEQPETIDEKSMDKEITPKKAPKDPKSKKLEKGSTDSPKEIQEKEEAPKDTKPLKIDAPLKEPPLEPPMKGLTKEDKIIKFEKYIEDLQGMLQQLEEKLYNGSISREKFIEKRKTIDQKLSEAEGRLEELKND